MANKSSPRNGDTQLKFEALVIEGGLLAPDWLSRVAQLSAGNQKESDYSIPKGLNIREEIGRYWRMSQALWSDFQAGQISPEQFIAKLLMTCFGFVSLEPVFPVIVGERTYPIGHSALDGRVPVVISPAGTGIDAAIRPLGDGNRKRSAFGLVQEYLNAADDCMWGIASDGKVIRILRDNASLTRPAWIEADLASMFNEERYADFAAFWLLAHETRFGRAGQPSSECPLEAWRNAGREEGTRAREALRTNVEDALAALGKGFLAHPENIALRQALHDGSLSTTAYFNQLLRLIYRFIFLITVEERGLLHPSGSDCDTMALYQNSYSMRHLRDRSVKRRSHDRFHDLWESLRIVFRGLSNGEGSLALPALAGIFAQNQCPDLDRCKISNANLMLAVFRLNWLKTPSGLSRVNWRDMGPEELGSVYESLLELVPRISDDFRIFDFATGDETKGNARKTSGSYYTPDSLVQVLLDSALEPVVKDTLAKNQDRPADALLEISIVDPSCGSGHFLLAAARRVAAHVARLRTDGTPSAADYRHALRQVIGRCIYGVDLNPMAVELCKVSLWMEAVEPGLPLNFLDAHIRHGNSLLGTTPELMENGIPDDAWAPLTGDDKKIATLLKKRNSDAKKGQRGFDTLWSMAERSTDQVKDQYRHLESAGDETPEALADKERKWQQLLESDEYRNEKFIADAWCAAFVWPKQPGAMYEAAPTNELWRPIRDGLTKAPITTAKTVWELAEQYQFFHWHLAFPKVHTKGGFDVILGNPPWERIKLQEQEFFASRNEEIAMAANAHLRNSLIARLPNTDPILWNSWTAALREAEGQSHFVRNSSKYPLCGRGDINTYTIFAELNLVLLNQKGRAGFIVPGGIATDDTTKVYFSSLVEKKRLAALYHFENEALVFPGIHHAIRFALVSICGEGETQSADLVFYARDAKELENPERHFSLTNDDFRVLNPNTLTCPTFRSRRDAEINLKIYRRAGILWRDDEPTGNPWNLRFMAMFHMANDSALFHSEQADGLVPLGEAKMFHHYDHRFGTYEGQTQAQENQGKLPELDDLAHSDPYKKTSPRYWIDANEVKARLCTVWNKAWLLGWRDVTGATVQRTVVSSLIPWQGVGHKFPLALSDYRACDLACLYANLNAFTLDYSARQKVGGLSLTYFILKQFPILEPSEFAYSAAWTNELSIGNWILPRVLELTYTAWDLQPFARDVGYNGPPYIWDSERRFLLRCELDAAFFHLYEVSRNDVDYVMDTFPIVRKNEEKAFGEYKAKRVILEIYDEMTEAIRSGRPYQTRLNPPPADPSVTHPDTRKHNDD